MNKWSRPFESSRASASPAGPALASVTHHYFAFLSYSHADSAEADWLHKELEQFRVPSSLAGKLTSNGVIPKRLTPIFRDRHELAAAHDLGSEIREALAGSHCLIILCSPAAAQSKWTNAEIEEFKRVHPEGCVIAAIVAGEPFASDSGREEEECFPPALRQKYDRRGRPTGRRSEPLAADLRDSGDGRRLGFLKIVAGMLGVGLDDLVQRDHLRRQRRLATIAASSLAGMIVAILLAVTAITARNEARDQRRAAESLVAFMVGDLKDKLEPIGRLDVLDSVGARALAYYEKQDMSDLSDDALAQRSKALTLLGQVASSRGNLDAALDYYRAAFAGTAEALNRSPSDPQRIYDHMQNVYYVGEVAYSRGDLRRAEPAFREYKRLATELIAADASNATWQMEGIYADNNLGVLLNDQGRSAEAAALFENALVDRERLARADPSNPEYRKAWIESLGWLATAREGQGRLGDSLAVRERQIELLDPLIGRPTADVEHKRQALAAYRASGRINGMRGNLEPAIERLGRALRLSDELVATEPENSFTRGLGAAVRLELAHVVLAAGQLAQAAQLTSDGCDLTERLIARDSTVLEWRMKVRPECLNLQTRVAMERGSPGAASDHANRLRALAAAEVQGADTPAARLVLANAEVLRGLAARSAGDRDTAVRAFRAAAAAWPANSSDRPPVLALRVLILKGLGNSSQASALARRLEATGYKDRIYLQDLRTLG